MSAHYGNSLETTALLSCGGEKHIQKMSSALAEQTKTKMIHRMYAADIVNLNRGKGQY